MTNTTQLRKALQASLAAKERAGHSRHVSMGFTCDEIEDIRINPETRVIAVTTPNFTMQHRASGYNIREMGEMVKWTWHCKR